MNFVPGAPVKAGDLLFVIDPRPFQAALRQAEANLAKDRAEANNARLLDLSRADLVEAMDPATVMGFVEIPPYYASPIPDTAYLELVL